MSLFPHETARLQAELQAADTDIAGVGAQLGAVQQTQAAAQSQLSGAQARLASAQAGIPALEAAAADADARVQELETELLDISEPDQQFPGRPPGGATAARLRRQLAQAEAAATAAHNALDDGRAAVEQASAELQRAQVQAAAAANALRPIQDSLAAAQLKRQTTQAELARIDQWNAGIAADPIDRPDLERTAEVLAARAAELDKAWDETRVRLEIERETLAALTARRDRIGPELDGVNGRLSAGMESLRVAETDLQRVSKQLENHFRAGPTP